MLPRRCEALSRDAVDEANPGSGAIEGLWSEQPSEKRFNQLQTCVSPGGWTMSKAFSLDKP